MYLIMLQMAVKMNQILISRYVHGPRMVYKMYGCLVHPDTNSRYLCIIKCRNHLLLNSRRGGLASVPPKYSVAAGYDFGNWRNIRDPLLEELTLTESIVIARVHTHMTMLKLFVT